VTVWPENALGVGEVTLTLKSLVGCVATLAIEKSMLAFEPEEPGLSTQAMSALEFASSPICTVPQVVVSGVLGGAMPEGVGGMHSTEGVVGTSLIVGNVSPRSVERAKNM
jgi:hypothetical protein